jgi:hypothetical protein
MFIYFFVAYLRTSLAALNDRTIMNNEFERMQKVIMSAQFREFGGGCRNKN